MMKSLLVLMVASCFLASGNDVQAKELISNKFRQEAQKWEKDIQALEKLNQTETYPDDSILFIGSSSIRLWKTIDDDLKPYHPIRRGFGGAKISDVLIYLPRLMGDNSFQAVVFFVGGNDLWGDKKSDKTPEQIFEFGNALIKHVRKSNPNVPLFFIEITPSPRRAYLDKQEVELNNAFRQVCRQNKSVYFISTKNSFLTKEKKRTTKWFSEDQLHMNHEGYKLWSTLIKARLDAVLKSSREENNN